MDTENIRILEEIIVNLEEQKERLATTLDCMVVEEGESEELLTEALEALDTALDAIHDCLDRE